MLLGADMRPVEQQALEKIRRAAAKRATELDLSSLDAPVGAGLAALPAEIGELTRLEVLQVSCNALRTLPPEIGQLSNLRTIFASSNQLVTLPCEIGQLSNLESLYLGGNRLNGPDSFPPEFSHLANLRLLSLDNNYLVNFPSQFLQLPAIEQLLLGSNQLESIPAEIGRLSKLQVLWLNGNNLRLVPRELANLSDTVGLKLEGNPLEEPLQDLAARGVEALFSYLRSLEASEPQYEAKLLLVGEGNVGKSTLIAALRGEPFIENRSTTHGIEVKALTLHHPEIDVNIKLNAWDFGGQEVYRITHQFFFSRRALYLLVWRPREGQEENAIEAWCQRIRLRVGSDARIIIVASHCDERHPELDYPSLRRKFADMLVGHFAVDSLSGTGLGELKQAIAEQAAHLPQMGELISSGWIAARDEILLREEPQISFDQFTMSAEAHGLNAKETYALAALLHDTGYIMYYGEDEGLRDIVVLRPEWLTKAIGYVLEDTPTRNAGGLLAHARLKEIWRNRADGISYPVEYHPYFIRLMEKFDVSYRLPDETQASLIGQLVPYSRPENLRWDDVISMTSVRSLSLTCHTMDEAPGLVAWLTVRNHRFSTGQYWRRGVLLRHSKYASQALIELFGDYDLSLHVRAPSPDYFFNILRDSIEDLIAQRWPGLDYDLLVPCPTIFEDGTACSGQFKLRSLQMFREQDESTIPCYECAQHQDICRLLTGFSMPSIPELPGLHEVRERLDKVAEGVSRIEAYAADAANEIRAVLKAVTTEVDDCPRVFTFTPTRLSGLGRAQFWKNHYRLTLWCEHPGAWHPEANYDVENPKAWLQIVAPYALLVTRTLALVVPIAGAAAGLILNSEDLKRFQHEIELTQVLVEKLLPVDWKETDLNIDNPDGLTPAQGAGLRMLRAVVLELDPHRSFGDLRRVSTPSGDFLWICSRHYREYDPGLPAFPSVRES